MTMTSDFFQDWRANVGNPKGRFVMVFFRLCSWLRGQRYWWIGAPVLLGYVLLVHWLMGIELDYRTKVGPGLALHHGVGLVVHWKSVIGAGCVLRHGVTLGERTPSGACPTLEDGVSVGALAIVLGGVRIGRSARIGAGAVVLTDLPEGAVAVGNPARVVRIEHGV